MYKWICGSICYLALVGQVLCFYYNGEMQKAMFWAVILISATISYNSLFVNKK